MERLFASRKRKKVATRAKIENGVQKLWAARGWLKSLPERGLRNYVLLTGTIRITTVSRQPPHREGAGFRGD